MKAKIWALYLAAIAVLAFPYLLILFTRSSQGAIPTLFGGGLVLSLVLTNRAGRIPAIVIGSAWILVNAVLIAIVFPMR